MYEKNKYNFYFDETGHDRKIRYKAEKNKMNFDQENSFLTHYVGTFCYIKDINYKDLISKLNKLINNLKNYKNSKKEFKATNYIINSSKEFKFGIASLKDKNLYILNKLFDFIIENNIKVQTIFISKMTFIFEQIINNFDVDEEKAKLWEEGFVMLMRNLNYNELLKKIKDEENFIKIRKIIKKFLKDKLEILELNKLECKDFNNEKCNTIIIERHIEAAKSILALFNKTKIKELKFNFNEMFDYNDIVDGFSFLLTELKLKNSQVDLYIDYEESSFRYFEKMEKLNLINKLYKKDSKDEILLSLPDFFGYYISKIIESFERFNRDNFDTLKGEKMLLSIEFFNLNFDAFELIKKTLKIYNEEFQYFSTYNVGNNHVVKLVYSYFLFFDRFDTFKKYQEYFEKNKSNLGEELNTILIMKIKDNPQY